MEKKPIYKRFTFYLILSIVVIILVFGIPILINELYKINKGYLTLWGAEDVLAFYAVILSGIITIFALVITIYFSKKDTEKQIKYYMSQTKAPFFVIENIIQKGKEKDILLSCNNNKAWKMKYYYDEDGRIKEYSDYDIEIHLRNIGDGIAFSPRYKVEALTGFPFKYKIVNRDESLILNYSLQDNLNNKYICEHIQKMYKTPCAVIHYTYLNITYKNILGVDLQQSISIEIRVNTQDNVFDVTFNEISPQSIKK